MQISGRIRNVDSNIRYDTLFNVEFTLNQLIYNISTRFPFFVQNAPSTLHSLLTLETMRYSYLSCCYFSRQKIGLSSTKVKISCLQKNFPHCIFITVPYRLQKFVPKLFLSLTHFTRKTTSTIFRYECKQINISSTPNVYNKT